MVANLGLMLDLPHKSEFRVANSCGSAKFATRAGLEQLELAWWMLIMVANLGLMLDLPHKSELRVANSCGSASLPHEQGWNSWILLGGC